MPLSKVTGKTRGANQRTHAHYKGEFGSTREPGKQTDQVGGRQRTKSADGSKRLSKENSKDPHYRAARAEHFAGEAMKAHAAHTAAKTPEDKLKHEAIIAHAMQRAGVHSRFVTKSQPGSQLADDAVKHAHVAKHLHDDVMSRKTDAKESEKIRQADERKKKDQHEQDERKKKDQHEQDKRQEKEKQERAQHVAELKKVSDEAKAHAQEAKKSAEEAKKAGDESHGEKSVRMANEMRHTSDMIRAHMMDGDQAKAEQLYSKLQDQHKELSEHVAKRADIVKQHESKMDSDDLTASYALKYHLRDAQMHLDSGHALQSQREAGVMSVAKYMHDGIEFKKALTTDQFYAIRNYSDHTDKILNNTLRKNKGEIDPKKDLYSDLALNDSSKMLRHKKQTTDTSVGRELHDLDSAIASHKLSEDTKVYRALADPGGAIMGSLKVGSVFKDHGYVSTTSEMNVMNGYRGGKESVDMHISLKKGMSAAPMYQISSHRDEFERLLPRGSSFRVTKIETAGSRKTVHVEVAE